MGGFTAASLISKQMGGSGLVTVVEPQSRLPFPPAFQWLVFGWRQPEKIQRNPTGLTKRKNVRMVSEKVEKIDVSGRSGKTQSQTIRYDKLVISLGTEFAFDQVAGLEAYSHNAYSIEGALKLRGAIDNFDGGSIATGISRLPIKCPPAPYELALLLEEHFRRIKKRAEIHFFTPEPHPVPAAGPRTCQKGRRPFDLLGV